VAVALRGLDSRIRPAAEYTLQLARQYGLTPEITSVFRTNQQQSSLYQTFLAGKAEYPANPPGLSAHEYGMAWDSVVPAAQQPLWTAIRQAVGWRVPPNDVIHAEVPNWWNYVVLSAANRAKIAARV
jgi:D-alanyl-D-alanine carboxypeptidase